MRLQDVIPYMVCVNLAQREDYREEAWERFRRAGLRVDRQPGVDRRWVRDTRGFQDEARYASSLAKRLAIRRAKLAGAPAVLLFEDNVVLAPDLHERLEAIELPQDWGIFFLGCKHLTRPEIVAPGLVKVTRGTDHHAMAVRAEYFDAALKGMAGHPKHSKRTIPYSGLKMAAIQTEVPTYAAFPNLAWQTLSRPEMKGGARALYRQTGAQRTELEAIDGLGEEMARLVAESQGDQRPAPEESPPVAVASNAHENENNAAMASETPATAAGGKDASETPSKLDHDPPGFGFLAGQPPRYRLEELFPLRFYINLARREDRRVEIGHHFEAQALKVERLAAADGRRARKTRGHGPPNKYACRLSHRMAVRAAKLRGSPAVMIFEDDAVLHPDFRRLAEALPPPEDWAVLFFGCTHVKTPEVVAPGWTRVTSVWGMQTYAVRHTVYDLVLRRLRAVGRPGALGTDIEFSRLASEIPVYAIYPNLSWQDEGYSDLLNVHRRNYRQDGSQNRFRSVLYPTNRAMKEAIAARFGASAPSEPGPDSSQPGSPAGVVRETPPDSPCLLRRLTLVPSSGWGNRLRSIASARRLCAKLGATLHVRWDWGKLEDFFLPMEDLKPRPAGGAAPKKIRHNTSTPSPRVVDVTFPDIELNTCYTFGGSHEAAVSLEDVLPFLPKLQPELQGKVDEFAQSQSLATAVGMHIRRTDNKKSKQGSPDRLFVEAATHAMNQGRRIFLATDNRETEEFMKSVCGDSLILFPKRTSLEVRWPRKFDRTAAEDDLIELILLSRTQFILGSYWSSFSGLAMKLNGSPDCRILREDEA